MRLFRQFILRHLFQERVRSATTLSGIALGIAAILAIRLANASSLRGFESALDMIAGKTSLEIFAPGTGLDETRLLSLGWLTEFGEVSPVIEAEARIRLASGRSQTLRVLGIDILRDHTIRDYRLVEFAGRRREPMLREFLDLLIDPDSIVVTEKFAERNSLRIGQNLEVTTGDRIRHFTVQGLLKDDGPARALDGNFALMDIAAAQWAFGFHGRITRVDLRLRDGGSVDAVERQIAARLPDGLEVRRPERRGREVEKMLSAFHFNLSALSYIALLVGLFLIYNTVAVSVISRREEIGTLRALGTSRRAILGLFLGEAGLLAAAGCALGLLLARFFAYGAVTLTSTTVTVLYRSLVSVPPPLSPAQVALAFGIGIPLALASAGAPAVEASRVTPVAAMRGADRIETRFRLRARYWIAPALFFALGACLAGLGPVQGLPVYGFLAALAIAFGGASLTPAALYGMGRVGRRVIFRLFRVEGRLAHSNLVGSIPRLSISVAALSLSLSMMVAIAIMVGSFRETVLYWAGQTLRADLFVSPAMPTVGANAALSPEVEKAVSRHPAVAAVDRFHRLEVPFDESRVWLAAGDFAVRLAHGNLLFKVPADGRSAMLAAIGKDEILVSESFSLKHQRKVGDLVKLPTPLGFASFRIVATYYDYSSDAGIAIMDNATFRRHFGELAPASMTVYLQPGFSADAVRDDLMERLGGRYSLLVQTNRSLRREILRVFDSTFAITYALELIAVFVAILGVAATLVTLILERRRDLAVLRLVGANRHQVRKMVVIEAVLMGAASQIIGIGVGLALSLLLIYVINVQSFGWTIQFHLPAAFLSQMSILVLAATAVSGLYPARRACAFDAAEQVAEE